MTPLRIAIFLLVVLFMSGLLHGFVWWRMVYPLPAGAVRTLGSVLTVVGMLLLVAAPISARWGGALAIPMAWVGYAWMGVLFWLFALLFAAEPLRWLVHLVWVKADPALQESRRALLAWGVSAAAATVTAGMTVVGIRTILVRPRIVRLRVELDRWPAALAGFRIVQLTDIHVSQTIRGNFVRMITEETNALQPDLIAITGDLVDGTVDELGSEVAPLADLRAAHGVFFITGNHEYYSQVDGWMRYLPTLGMRVLRNERVEISKNGGTFDLAGIDDWSAHEFGNGHGADPDRALGGRTPDRPVVLLAHQPKHIDAAVQHDVDLQLSGHTHGGQMWPFHHLVTLDQPFLSGLHKRARTWIYVSCGTGYWGPPMRLGAPPEITVLEIHPPATATA